ncbi:hypothetical protein EV383_4431 [Pseudonocardia sediminis]|uniref:Uncharacterized protein n=1 Tax=Pseudonocardia sediminis TaxID=1397368 RepID=A0A4Q7UZS5_PSEST|nr:hypothetical protein [Pseudonocardia sediminis]RZT87506.1 hypothetical protein EV383_4431 [Pseudonocardia sediminis]
MTTTVDNTFLYSDLDAAGRVSTIRPGLRAPFETAIFGGPLAGQAEYHFTEDEARDGHARWEEKLREVKRGQTEYARSVRAAAEKREAVRAVRDAYRKFELREDAETRDALIAALTNVPD